MLALMDGCSGRKSDCAWSKTEGLAGVTSTCGHCGHADSFDMKMMEYPQEGKVLDSTCADQQVKMHCQHGC